MQVLRNLGRIAPNERANAEWTPMPLEEEPRSGRSGRSSTQELEEESCDGLESARLNGSDELECDYEQVKDMIVDLPLEPLAENIYGFVMASLIKDSADMRIHPEHCLHSLRPLRIAGAFLLCFIMFGMQAFFVIEAKKLVTPHDVQRARQVYGLFEDTMYTDAGGKPHVFYTVNGYARGYNGYFNKTNFAKLSPEEKESICRVPLSQPYFLFGVLFIWTLTVLHHMRQSINLFIRIMNLETLPHMDKAVKVNALGQDEVVGLTCLMKITLVTCVQCPRVCMNSFLLWLGARWLTATLGFGDLLLNALALEFILNLSGLLYDAMVPYNGKLLVQRTLIPHLHNKEMENCCNMFGMFSVGVIATVFCIVYMLYLQAVLPEYKWDIHLVCKGYLAKELAV